MALSQQDKTEIKEMLQDCMSGSHARTEAQFLIIDNKLDGINTHLKELNGKVASHEKRLNEIDITYAVNKANEDNYDNNRAKNCPQLNRIETLEKDKVVKLGIKQFMIGTIGIISIMIGIAFSSVKIAEHYNNRNQEELIQKIKDEIKNDKYEVFK